MLHSQHAYHNSTSCTSLRCCVPLRLRGFALNLDKRSIQVLCSTRCSYLTMWRRAATSLVRPLGSLALPEGFGGHMESSASCAICTASRYASSAAAHQSLYVRIWLPISLYHEKACRVLVLTVCSLCLCSLYNGCTRSLSGGATSRYQRSAKVPIKLLEDVMPELLRRV